MLTRTRLPVNHRRFAWRHGDNIGWFVPNARLTVSRGGLSRLHTNPPAWSSDEPLTAARIFVGFNVGARPVWTIEDAIRIVRRVRKEQVGVPDSTFLYQRGLYTHKSSGETVEEDGTQIIFLNLPDFGVTKADFERQALDLAETLATELDQEEVIVEIQRGGMTEKTIGVAGLQEEE